MGGPLNDRNEEPLIIDPDFLAEVCEQFNSMQTFEAIDWQEISDQFSDELVRGAFTLPADQKLLSILGDKPAAGLRHLCMIALAHRRQIIKWEREAGLEPRLFSAVVRLREGGL